MPAARAKGARHRPCLLLACGTRATATATATPLPRARTPVTTNSLSTTTPPPSLTQQYPAGTCREHAQAKYAKSWDTRISLASATPSSRYTATSHTRAQARTHHHHLLVHRSLHTHTTTSLPPPLSSILHLQLCSSSPPPPPTNTTPSYPTCPPSYHDFFGNQSPPVHVPVKTDRHSIQPAL